MNTANFNLLKNGMVSLMAMILLMSVVLSSFPKSSAANDIEDEPLIMEGVPDEIIELIEDTEGEIVYKALEDGKVYLYEEQTVGDVVTTKKSLVEDGTTTLTEKFSTESVLEDDTITVTQVDLINNKIIHQDMISTGPPPPGDDLTVVPPVYKQGVTPTNEFTTMATGTWVTTRATGNNYKYYKFSNGGGLARKFNREKRVGSYSSAFDTYTRNVDALRSFERSLPFDMLLISAADKAAKTIKRPTVANLKKFIIKYAKTVPGLGTLYTVLKYFSLTNKTSYSYDAIRVPSYRWR